MRKDSGDAAVYSPNLTPPVLWVLPSCCASGRRMEHGGPEGCSLLGQISREENPCCILGEFFSC